MTILAKEQKQVNGRVELTFKNGGAPTIWEKVVKRRGGSKRTMNHLASEIEFSIASQLESVPIEIRDGIIQKIYESQNSEGYREARKKNKKKRLSSKETFGKEKDLI